MLIISVEYTAESHKYCAGSFNVCSKNTMFELQRTRIENMQFAVDISDTPVTLRQSQVYQPGMTVQTHQKSYLIIIMTV